MVMSQGTYTFLTCFAGFWVVWALIVMLCCFCSFVQRKLRRRRRGAAAQPPEQGLHGLEMEPLENCDSPRQEPFRLCPSQGFAAPPVQAPHTVPQGSWTASRDTDVFGKPPCYEDAVLMEDPPPPYSEVLADTRAGTYTKPEDRMSRKSKDLEMSKMSPDGVSSEGTYSSLIHLPMAEHWDSLGRLLSTIDLNRNNLPPSGPRPSTFMASASPREGGTSAGPGPGRALLDPTCDLPTAFLVFGRSTAV